MAMSLRAIWTAYIDEKDAKKAEVPLFKAQRNYDLRVLAGVYAEKLLAYEWAGFFVGMVLWSSLNNHIPFVVVLDEHVLNSKPHKQFFRMSQSSSPFPSPLYGNGI